MRRIGRGLVAALCAGCSSPGSVTPAEPPPASAPTHGDAATPAAKPASEADAADSDVPSNGGERDAAASSAKHGPQAPEAAAESAYAAALEAYAAKDADAYFDAFADPMTCFYGEQSAANRVLEEARKPYFDSTDAGTGPLATMAILPVHVTPDEVVLIHWGAHRDGPGKKFAYPLFSRKALVMTAVDGHWKISAEFSFGTSRCYGDVFRGVMAPRCIRRMGKCMTSCCKPDRAGSVQCEYCESQCAELYEACSTEPA